LKAVNFSEIFREKSRISFFFGISQIQIKLKAAHFGPKEQKFHNLVEDSFFGILKLNYLRKNLIWKIKSVCFWERDHFVGYASKNYRIDFILFKNSYLELI
jgi:hypothetical protein